MVEGAGAADTTVGTMTVAMAANAAGVRDATGNVGSFTARTPLDKAKPAAVTVTDTNGAADGRIEPGDTVSITFSEPLAPTSVPSPLTTITMADPTGTGNDTLTLLGVTNGARTLGGTTYITTDATSAVFANSPVGLSNANRTVTVTVGPACSGTGCVGIGQRTTNANFSYIAAPTLTDEAGNTAATQSKVTSMRMF
jgi:large repetitive protein